MPIQLRGLLIAVACGVVFGTQMYWIANPEAYLPANLVALDDALNRTRTGAVPPSREYGPASVLPIDAEPEREVF